MLPGEKLLLTTLFYYIKCTPLRLESISIILVDWFPIHFSFIVEVTIRPIFHFSLSQQCERRLGNLPCTACLYVLIRVYSSISVWLSRIYPCLM